MPMLSITRNIPVISIAIALLFFSNPAFTADGDADNDRIPDAIEGDGDADADGIPNYLDLDSDGDGVLDTVEAGHDPANPLDTDNDGTPDFLDTDSDNDGIPDAVEYSSQDTDGDGIPDNIDLDSDNDTIPDEVESNVNTDGDANPDYLDWDSDADGIPDRAEAGPDPSNPVDSDGDGLPDYIDRDSDADGIPDSVEQLNDADGDGIFSYLDTDSDNDGIPDSVEGVEDADGNGIPDYIDSPLTENDIDTDGDGVNDADDRDDDNDGLLDFQEHNLIDSDGDSIVDSKDLDSDNDAICDVVEGGGIDLDGTCKLTVSDTNNYGIPDIVASFPLSLFDTDGDGVPNVLDLDSDGDTLFDLTENGSFDIDNNGIIDRFLDENGDGMDDTTPFVTLDLDEDGIPDYVDPFIGNSSTNAPSDDASTGSIPDTETNSGDNTPPAFESSVTGYGAGCSMGSNSGHGLLLLLLLSAVIMMMRQSRRFLSLILFLPLIFGCTISNNPGTFNQSMYFSMASGASRLDPEAQTSNLRVTDENDISSSITIGADLTKDFSVEFSSHVLGEAEIGAAGAIQYDVSPSLSLVRYAFRTPAKQRARVGFAGFGKIGAAVIETDSQVEIQQNNDTSILVGLGLEYVFYNGIGVRAEFQSFDSDAQSLTAGLTYRFGQRPAKPKPVKDTKQGVPRSKILRVPQKRQ